MSPKMELQKGRLFGQSRERLQSGKDAAVYTNKEQKAKRIIKVIHLAKVHTVATKHTQSNENYRDIPQITTIVYFVIRIT